MDGSGWKETQQHKDYLTCPDSLWWDLIATFIAGKAQRFVWEAWGNPATHSPTHMLTLWCQHTSVLLSARRRKDNRKQENKRAKVYNVVERRASLETGDLLTLMLADATHTSQQHQTGQIPHISVCSCTRSIILMLLTLKKLKIKLKYTSFDLAFITTQKYKHTYCLLAIYSIFH